MLVLLELGLQGVRGFADGTRLRMKPGLNVLRSDHDDARRTVIESIFHTMYPSPTRHHATEHLATPTARESRLALTFQGRDEKTYRLLRDTKSGAAQVQRFEPNTKTFQLIGDLISEVAQFVRVQNHLPEERDFEQIFVISREFSSFGKKTLTAELDFGSAPSAPGLPLGGMSSMQAQMMSSALSDGSGDSGGGLGGSGLGGLGGSGLMVQSALVGAELAESKAPAPVTETTDQKEERFKQLSEELIRARQAEQARPLLDRAFERRRELEVSVRRLAELTEQTTAFQLRLSTFEDLSDLPEEVSDSIKSFDQAKARYQTDLAKFIGERRLAEEELARLRVIPLHQDQYFLLSVGFVALCFALAIWLRTPWIAFFNLFGALVATGSAFRWVSELESVARVRARLTALEERDSRLTKGHDQATQVVRKMLENRGLESSSELMGGVQEAQAVKEELLRLTEELEDLRADPMIMSAAEELKKLSAEVERLEAVVLSVEGLKSPSALAAELEESLHSLARELAAEGRSVALPDRSKSNLALARRTSSQKLTPASAVATGDLALQLPVKGPLSGVRVVTGDIVPGERKPEPSSTTTQIDLASDAELKASGSREIDLLSAETLKIRPRAKSGAGSPERVDSSGKATEDDGEEGYGSGYGGQGSGGGGDHTASGDERDPLLAGPSSGMGGASGSASSYDGGGGAQKSDPGVKILASARGILLSSFDPLLPKLTKRMGEYLKSLTGAEFDSAQIGTHSIKVGRQGGDLVSISSLNGDTAANVELAVRFSMTEACAAASKAPVLIDDPFVDFHPSRRKAFLQMLTYLSSSTQVLVLTEAGDVEGNVLQS